MPPMPLAAEKLIDWRTARVVGEQVAGKGTPMSAVERARLLEDFGEVVPEAEALVREFTGLASGEYRARPWVMTRAQWLQANLHGFERILEPFAAKVVTNRSDGALAGVRRNVLAAQVGGLLGYLGHRVLGQYDLFLPADDDGLIYFVGPNIAGVERKFGFPPRDFRLWLSLHEVSHRLQFAGAPWLRGYLLGLMDTYLGTVEIDPGWLVQAFKRAIDEVRSGSAEYRGFGWIFLLMTPEQREMVRQMQAMMSLLEGHGNFVMDEVSRGRVQGAESFRRTLHERRTKAGVEKAFQKAIGFDVKVRQYALGEGFIAEVVREAGMDTFNRVWEKAANLPTMEEIARPQDWVARVGAA
jgi:coenzyme F420 biosynthesis associated uncharacterized protein